MWLHVPNCPETSSPCAPESADSTTGCDWLFPMLARNVWSRGKRLRSRAWSRKWNTASWLRHLAGRILPPSTASRGVESWIRSLRGFHANQQAWPASEKAPATSDGFGVTCSESSAKSSRRGCSLKTSPVCSLHPAKGWGNQTAATLFEGERWERFSGDWPRWGSLRNGAVFQREPLDLRRDACGGSVWPTATASDSVTARNRTSGRKEGSRHHDGVTLTDAMQLWATPTTRDHKDGSSPSEESPTNALLGRQAPRMTQDGKWFLPITPNSPLRCRLNPRFVAWLQGIPWAALTLCGSTD